MRLDKFLVETGIGSRSEVKRYIKAKQIRVNNVVTTKPEQHIDPNIDVVCYRDEKITYAEYDYVMLHKPKGVVSATEDPVDQTVLDLLPNQYHRVFPVGRLDKDTTGLLLLTNHGQLAHLLLSPKHHVHKVYEVTLEKPIDQTIVPLFKEGITLEDGYVCLPSDIVILSETCVHLMIYEGKFHQVKRMFKSVGNRVVALKRLQMGTLSLDDTLNVGEYRLLTEDEIKSLEQLTGLTL